MEFRTVIIITVFHMFEVKYKMEGIKKNPNKDSGDKSHNVWYEKYTESDR